MDSRRHPTSEPDRALLAAFERDGFVGPIDLLTAGEVADVRTAVADVIANLDRYRGDLYEVEMAHTERPEEVVCHFLGGFRVNDVLARLVRHRTATHLCAALLRTERMRFFHDQVFAKPPGHPGVVPWHQDYSYWTRTAPARHITINVMLDDADEASGCLQFVRGSHRWPLLPMLPFDAPMDAVLEHIPAGAPFEPVAVPLRAGQATIHHSHTLHGSGPNRSQRWRRAAVLNYMADGVCVVDDAEPLLRGVPRLPNGAPVAGPDFPLVYGG
ncbi:MAG: phytanoyl-CoA dioxygenase family protein [Planctomycetota bacterium]